MGFCFVPNCYSEWTEGRRTRGVWFHRFPADQVFRRIWKIKIRSIEEPSATSRVCSRHFGNADYIMATACQLKCLRSNAIPSRQLPTMSYQLATKRASMKAKKLLELQRKKSKIVTVTIEKDFDISTTVEVSEAKSVTTRCQRNQHKELKDDPDWTMSSVEKVPKQEVHNLKELHPRPNLRRISTCQEVTGRRAAHKCCVPYCAMSHVPFLQITWFTFPDERRWRRLWYEAIFGGRLAQRPSKDRGRGKHGFNMTCQMIQPSGSEVTLRCWALQQPPAYYRSCYENNLLLQLRERLGVNILNEAELCEEIFPGKKENALVCSTHFLDGRPTAKNPIPQYNLGPREEKIIHFTMTATHEDHTYADADVEKHLLAWYGPVRDERSPSRAVPQPSPVPTPACTPPPPPSPPTVSVARLKLSSSPLPQDEEDDPLLSNPVKLAYPVHDHNYADFAGFNGQEEAGSCENVDMEKNDERWDELVHSDHTYAFIITVNASDSTLWGQYNVSPLAEACYESDSTSPDTDSEPSRYTRGVTTSDTNSVPSPYTRGVMTSDTDSVPSPYTRGVMTSDTDSEPSHYTRGVPSSYTNSLPMYCTSNVTTRCTGSAPVAEVTFTADQELFFMGVKQEVEFVDTRRESLGTDRHLASGWKEPTIGGYSIKQEVFHPGQEVSDGLDIDPCDPLAFETHRIKQEPSDVETDPCGSFQFVDVSNLMADYHPSFDDMTDDLDSLFLPT